MKRSLLFAFLLCSGIAGAQAINFPDANFKAKLLSATYTNYVARDINGMGMVVDANGNGEIEQTEAMQVGQLNVQYANITSLDGIEYFQNLQQLHCRGNQITTLNYALPSLTLIMAYTNVITTLDVSGSPLLTYLDIHNNQLASLGTLPVALETLDCSGNLLGSLDVANLASLKWLICGGNQINALNFGAAVEHLDISGNPLPAFNPSQFPLLLTLNCNNIGSVNLNLAGLTNLGSVYCSGNPFTTLNTDDLTGLSFIELKNSQLTHLDLSHSPYLSWVHIADNTLLESINLHNAGVIQYSGECDFTNNPNLDFICVDEGEEASLLEYFEFNQVVPPFMSTDCTSIPENEYNSIAGLVTYDFNNDGCDANDMLAVLAKIKFTDGTAEKIRYTYSDGNYFMYTGPGNYDISVETENQLFAYTPSPASVNFAGWNGEAHIQDFCLTANGVHPDVEILIWPSGAALPGFDAYYQVLIRNKGNQTLSGAITFNYNDAVSSFVSANPVEASQSAGLVNWNYTDLKPFERRYMMVRLNINAPTDTPAVNIDDILTYTAQISATAGDDHPEDNTFEFDQTVVGSYDPNNILCLEGDVEETQAIGDYLHYVVNFENIGNFPASFVVVTQEIDEAMYDMGSFELISTSHAVSATLNGNKVEFRFDDINLAAQEMGNVVYKIKSLQSLEEGDEVKNSASIVFDFNLPIPTNDAVTTFETVLGDKDITLDNSVKVYPNPSKGMVKIDAATAINAIHLYDLQGRLLYTGVVNDTNTLVDLTNRAAGVYLLKITTDKGAKVEKLIKE